MKLQRTICGLCVLVMVGISNNSVAQKAQTLNNERKIVECTPVKTKRDIAFERQQMQELQVAERNQQSDKKEVLSTEDNKDYSKFIVKPEEMKATEMKLSKKKVVTETEMIDDE